MEFCDLQGGREKEYIGNVRLETDSKHLVYALYTQMCLQLAAVTRDDIPAQQDGSNSLCYVCTKGQQRQFEVNLAAVTLQIHLDLDS